LAAIKDIHAGDRHINAALPSDVVASSSRTPGRIALALLSLAEEFAEMTGTPRDFIPLLEDMIARPRDAGRES
jgi:hypothetical protein